MFAVQVNFSIDPANEKKREKFLTAKYGAHQMALIRYYQLINKLINY
jgi:hypothetical protein